MALESKPPYPPPLSFALRLQQRAGNWISSSSPPCLASTCKAGPPIMAHGRHNKQSYPANAATRPQKYSKPSVTSTTTTTTTTTSTTTRTTLNTTISKNISTNTLNSSSVPSSPLSSTGGYTSPAEGEFDIHSEEHDSSWISNEDKQLLRLLDKERRLGDKGASQAKNLRALLPGCVPVRLVGEGAANVVFEFTLPDGSYLFNGNTRLLLRVAKQPVGGKRPRFNYLTQQRFYHNRVQPILGTLACYQELVTIRNSGIVDAINSHLRRVDDTRRAKFRGTFIEQTNWGFLIEDMQPPDPKATALVEFKPKWLSQSPSAPANAIRCRQCAREFQNFMLEPSRGRRTPEVKHCPLLLGRDNSQLTYALDPFRIAPGLAEEGDKAHLAEVLRNLWGHETLQKLRELQERNDSAGPLRATETNLDLSLAMTLRDCTMYVHVDRHRFSEASTKPRLIRFGDWDMKDPTYKLQHWRDVEEDLIRGGYYTAEWVRWGSKYYHSPTKCHLEMKPPKRTRPPDIISIQDENETYAHVANTRGKVFKFRTNAKLLTSCLTRYQKELPGKTPVFNPMRSEPK